MNRTDNHLPKELELAQTVVHWMDDRFRVPFTKFRFGLDPLIGLIRWAGDAVSFLISDLVVKSLVTAGMPSKLIRKMVWNIVLDLLVGGIPLIGDAWDFFNKANRKNLKLAKDYFEGQSGK